MARVTGQLSELPIEIDDGGGQTLSEVRAKARRWRAQHPPGQRAILAVDYLQLTLGDRKSHNREQEVAEISRGLKALAKELNLPVLALAQIGREVDKRSDKRPTMSDLRESGSIEQDADIVIQLYRDEVYYKEKSEKKGIAEWIIGANRHGPTGTVETYWSGHYMRFDPIPKQQRYS